MADRNLTVVTTPTAAGAGKQPIWMIQAEEAKLKSEAEKAAAAKAAFEATFKNVDSSNGAIVCAADSDEDEDEDDEERERRRLAQKPIGPVDPSKCTAAGAGIAGGTACAPSTFVVVTKDADNRKVSHGGEEVKVRVSPGVGVGGSDQDGIVKDVGDGTYSVTYVVAKRGNYMVNVECNGKPIMGSPFPVFFSSGSTASGGLLGIAPLPTFPNMVNQSMPNMPNYSGSASGAFPGLLGMIPGIIPGANGGVILPGIGASLGEVCREYLSGRCAKTDCKFTHPQHHLLVTALGASSSMGNVNQAPLAPSAAAMAAAHAIVTAQVMQAHAAQAAQYAKESSGSSDKEAKGDALKKTLQVSNLSTLLTLEQLKQLFGLYGTVVECSVTDSKHFAYIEYSKPEEATAGLALNNMDVAGRPLNVEMAKSLPPKSALTSSSLPLMMQQAVAMQQMQFQQALLVQQSVNQQQAANRAASMKSATELAAARAAEISRSLNPDGLVSEHKEPDNKSRSPSPSRAKSRSRSKSKSPVSYRFKRSISPRGRYSRGFRSRSPVRYRHYSSYQHGRRSYRDGKDDSSRSRRDSGRSYDRRSPVSRRYRSRSGSPRIRKQYRDDSYSPKHHRDSESPRPKKSSRPDSRSPEPHKSSKSSMPKDEITGKHRKRSRSRSVEETRNSEGRTRKASRSSPRAERKSKRRHSRSRSPEERRREGKSKHHDRRRSRSRSAEGKRHKGGDTSPRHLDDGKSKHRKRSRSKSPERKNRPKDDVQRGIRNENIKPHKARTSKYDDESDSKDTKDVESDDGGYEKNRKGDDYKSERTEPTMIEQNLSD